MKRAAISRWVSSGALILLAAGGVYGYAHFRKGHQAPDIPTAQAKRGDFSVVVTCRGDLVALHSVQLVAPRDVQELQLVWLAPAGASVHAGDAVARFDPSKLQQDIHDKTVALQQAQATLDQAQAKARDTAGQDQLDSAQAQYDRDKAQLEASKKTIVSAMDGQKSAIDLGLAEEKVRLERATIELHRKSDEATLASKRRLRDQAQMELNRTQTRLGQMELKSPLDGVVEFETNTTQGWMNAQPFKVGDRVWAGLAIAEIPDLRTLQMESKVDEADRGRIAAGDQVRIHVDAYPEKVFSGKLSQISLLTEQSFTEWPPSRTFRAFAAFDDRDVRLRPGMNAAAEIVEQRIAGAISVPSRALFTVHGKPMVYVKTSDGFTATQVRVRARNSDEVAVDGIAAGALVALSDPEQKPS